jgi:hypothetical protein
VALDKDFKVKNGLQVLGGTQTTLRNFVFNIDQTVGSGQDDYVLTYDDGTGEIGLEASAGISSIRTPTVVSPLTSATDVFDGVSLTAGDYYNAYSKSDGSPLARSVRRFQLEESAGDFSTPLEEAALNIDAYSITYNMTASTQYKWRCRDEDSDGNVSAWTTAQTFTSAATQATTPTITGDPASENEGATVVLTITNYDATGTYTLVPTDGAASRAADTIYWTLPFVTATGNETLQILFTDSQSRGAPTVNIVISVVNVVVTADTAVQVTNYSASERYATSGVTYP